MSKKFKIVNLTEDYVTVVTQKVYEIDGEVLYGRKSTESYVNSELDRKRLKNNVPDPYYTSIMAIWGGEPTIETERPEIDQ